MKRSEMISKIKDFLEIRFGNSNAYGRLTTCEEFLKLIEDAGMLPPERYREMDWNKRGITYSEWFSEPSKINEWEPENE